MGRPVKDSSGKTQEQLAKEAGMSLSTWKAIQKDGDGGLSRKEGQELADEKKREEIELLRIRKAKEQALLDVLNDRYYPKEEVDDAVRAVAGASDLYDAAIVSELPALLSGMTPAQMKKELIKFSESWKTRRMDARDDIYKRGRAAVAKELRGDLKKVANRRKREE